MKLNRTYAIASAVVAGLFAVSACGSDNAPAASDDTAANDASAIDCVQAEIKASGSSAQNTAMTQWITDYNGQCADTTINYDPSGSGAGVTDFVGNLNDFAGSDSALKDDEVADADARCGDGNKAINLPMVASPIAVVFNLSGVDKLTLNAEVLSNIFAGAITTWNDPAIAGLNEGVTLPATTITTVHRSKDSGTTDNFTKYLEAAGNGAWTFGTGKAWTAPGGQGAPDSAGIVSAVGQTDGSISYVDGPDAKKNDLVVAALDFGQGPVELSDESVGKAIAAAEHSGEGNDIKLDLNYALSEAGAYPAVLVTYEIVCEKGLEGDKLTAVKSFLKYAVTDGQDTLSELGYSPLPEELRADVEKAVDALS